MLKMIVYRLVMLFIILSGISSAYCQNKEGVLFRIDDKEVSSDEFIYVYQKNNLIPDSLNQQQAIREYLDLYINFKLKVQEAYDLGMDTTEAFLSEFNMYLDQLSDPYLNEKEVTDGLVEEAYERLNWEVNASHILIRTQGEDTIKAYEQIITAYNRANKGESFPQLALEYSEDPSVKQNQGDLGYFTALQMVYPFENAAYLTDTGKISKPFRTKFGYHILKVNNRRPSKGEVEVAHIMIRFSQDPTEEEKRNSHKKIVEIRELLMGGADWDRLVSIYSEDQNTKKTGGVLNPFSYGRMIPVFAEAAFSLNDPGEFSEPVMTPYGWHIIKLIRKIPLEDLEIMRPELENQISKDSRSELSKIALIKRLKEENSFFEYSKVVNQMLTEIKLSVDSNMPVTDSSLVSSDSIIFSIGNKDFIGKDFIPFFNRRNPSNMKQTDEVIQGWYYEFVDGELIAYEKANLEVKYYDFHMLVNEYREGIMLFERMEDQVWNKAIIDSTGLVKFYNKNRNKYLWKERVYVDIYRSQERKILDSVRIMLNDKLFVIEEANFRFSHLETKKMIAVIDSLVIFSMKDTTQYIKIVGNMENLSLLRKELLDSTDNNNWCMQRCIWEERESDEVHIQLFTSSKKYLETIFNQNSTLNLQVESDFFEKGENEILNLVDWEPGFYELSIDDQEYLIEIIKKLKPQLKELDETRGKVISDYQEFLEKEWIKTLKKKYKVEINKKELKRVLLEFEQN